MRMDLLTYADKHSGSSQPSYVQVKMMAHSIQYLPRRRVALCFALCLAMFLGSCSSPTQPLSEQDILEIMANIPETPSPPRTGENEENDAWIITSQSCEWAGSFHTGYQQQMNKLATTGDYEFSRRNEEYCWLYVFAGTKYELSVTKGDTLHYTISCSISHPSGELHDYFFRGWYVRSGRAGRIAWFHSDELLWSYEWWQEGQDQIHRCSLFHPQSSTEIYVIRAYQDGSGRLDIYSLDPIWGEGWSYAIWDPWGHGSSSLGNW